MGLTCVECGVVKTGRRMAQSLFLHMMLEHGLTASEAYAEVGAVMRSAGVPVHRRETRLQEAENFVARYGGAYRVKNRKGV